MRLINTSTLRLETFSSSKNLPPYAILSHTWGSDENEVSFEEMMCDSPPSQKEKAHGVAKIWMTCHLALEEHKLNYAWVDTCCIDKSSSAELSEAINSMFKWYRQAAVCFAFLADWKPKEHTFDHCRWFTRGWTLQELIASKTVIFYDKTWQFRGSKLTYCTEIARISKIDEGVLTGQTQLADVPVAVRLSWAAERTTTREEDIAYSLIGIFDINMPMLYGEGHKAFVRLQEEIIKSHDDLSIFAWKALPGTCQDYMGILAPSPTEFKYASRMYPTLFQFILGPKLTFSISNRGVQFHAPLQWDENTTFVILLVFHFDLPANESATLEIGNRRNSYGVYLRMVGESHYVRALPHRFAEYSPENEGDDFTSLWVSKSLSTLNSVAISRREICVRRPTNLNHPDFGLDGVDFNSYDDITNWQTRYATTGPNHCWSSSFNTIKASLVDYFVAALHFKPVWSNEFQSFTLLCRFRNPRGALFSPGFWECDLLSEDAWSARESEDFIIDHEYALSCRDEASSLVTTTLELPHVHDSTRKKRVVLSLQRENIIESGQTKFFIDLQVEDGGKSSG